MPDLILFGAQDLYIAGLSKELVLSELERNYKYLDSLNELKKTEIDSGKLKPIEYDRKKIESQLDEFTHTSHTKNRHIIGSYATLGI